MKNKSYKKFLAGMFAAVMLLGNTGMPLHAEGTQEVQVQAKAKAVNHSDDPEVQTEGFFQYYIWKEQATIIEYIGNESDVVVPANIGGYPVQDIGQVFNKNNQIKTITFSKGFGWIDEKIAIDCKNLEKVVLPNGNYGISGTLKFEGCDKLTDVEVANGDKKRYHDIDGVLYYDHYLAYYPKGRTAKTYQVPEGTLKIREDAFADNTHLKKLICPASLNELEEGAIGKGIKKAIFYGDITKNVAYNLKSEDRLYDQFSGKDTVVYAYPNSYIEKAARYCGLKVKHLKVAKVAKIKNAKLSIKKKSKHFSTVTVSFKTPKGYDGCEIYDANWLHKYSGEYMTSEKRSLKKYKKNRKTTTYKRKIFTESKDWVCITLRNYKLVNGVKVYSKPVVVKSKKKK